MCNRCGHGEDGVERFDMFNLPRGSKMHITAGIELYEKSFNTHSNKDNKKIFFINAYTNDLNTEETLVIPIKYCPFCGMKL